MDKASEEVSALLRRAPDTHHVVYAITDGDDPDWATSYSDWLVNLSQMADLLATRPIRSERTFVLVRLDREYSSTHPTQRLPNSRPRCGQECHHNRACRHNECDDKPGHHILMEQRVGRNKRARDAGADRHSECLGDLE